MHRPRVIWLVTALLSTLVILGLAGPADAHGDTIHFHVAGDPSGYPRVTATWENDGEPVDEAIAGTLSAISPDGHALGPWPLIAVQGSPATFNTSKALPPGRWTVTVECSFPALGRGQAQITVDAASTAEPTSAAPVTGSPATTVPVKTLSAASAPPRRSAVVGTALWLAGAVAAGSILILLVRRRGGQVL